MSIHRKENIDKFPRHSDVLFDVVSMGEKTTSLRRTFFNTISMAKNRLCLYVFLNATSMKN